MSQQPDDLVCVLPDTSAAPPVDTWPPVGAEVDIFSALGREYNISGRVESVNGSGIRLKIDARFVRFYPWTAIAYTQWTPQAVLAADAAQDDASTVFDMDGFPAEPPPVLEEAMANTPWAVAWKATPVDTDIPEWYAGELHKNGYPIERRLLQPAVTRDIIDADTAWPNEGPMPAVDALAADDEEAVDDEDDGFLKDIGASRPRSKGQMILTPAVYGYRVPEVIAGLSPDAELAAWAAAHHQPEELDAIYKMHEGDFVDFMNTMRAQAESGQPFASFPPPFPPGEEPAFVSPPSSTPHQVLPFAEPDPQELLGDDDDEPPDPGFDGGPVTELAAWTLPGQE